jgi:isopentenyl phosphate kinase
VIVLKLGGSVVTEKDRPETVDEAALQRAAEAVGAAEEDLVLVHGGGSFGHHHADAHGVTPTEGTRDPEAVLAVHRAMCRLNEAVVAALRDAGAPAVPVHPLSAGHRDAGGALSYPAGAVETLLGEGFLPVLHGDGVAHEGAGVTVLSGDELVASLAASLAADRVGLCSTVPGVLDETGDVVDRVDRLADVPELAGSDATDVTGGMAGKVGTLLELDAEASVFGPEAITAFLAGERVGTTVGGEPQA